MAEDGFTFTPDDQDELRERIRARKAQQDAFKDQRNVYVETDNPDDAAYDLKKARELGIPREAIGGLREDYRADDALLKIEKLRAEAPKTSSWLRAPDNYAVAKDDTDTLGVIENAAKFANSLIKFGTGIPKATQAAAPGFKAQALGLAQSEVQQPQTYLDQLDAYRKAQAGRRFGLRIGGMEVSALPLLDMLAGPERPDPGMQGLLLGYGRYGDEYDREITGFLSGAAQPVENVLREEITKALSEQKALAPATEDFVADSLLSGWTSFINMIPTVAAAMATRNPTLASGLMGGQVYGQEYASGIVDYKLTPQAAKERAMMHSAIEFGTERLSLGIFLDLLKRDDTGIITKLAIGMGTEQIQEQGATFGQDFVDWQTLNPDKTIEQFLAERPAAAARTALATLVASGAMQGTMIAIDETVKQLGRDATATQTSPGDKAINDILDAAGKSKLGNRSPAALKDFIDQTTAGTEIETVTVDLDGVVEALQQKGIDPTETLAALGVSDDMLAQKWEQFGEVEVRMSTLAVSPAMREHRDAVQPHVRTQNDEYTPAKKEQVAANLRADVAREAETIREAFANGIELEAQQQAVADRVRQRIRGAGILAERAQENASVAIQTAMVTTLARRIGEDPVAFFDRHYPRIQGDIDGMVSEEGALEQNAQDPKSTLPALFHGGRAGLTLDDIQIVREPGATKQGKKNRVYGGFYGTSKLEEAQGYAEATEGSTVYRIELTPDAKVETKEGDVTRLSAQTIQEYRDRGVDVVVGKDPRGRTEYVVINKDAITGLVDSGDLLAQEITMPDLENKDEVEAALNDPETDVLPLTEGMQILELDEFIAFHGTTAKFDQFKSDKIGAGEGAQAFGPGHYFTQSAGVANWYRKRMKKLSPGIKLGKESFNKANPAHFALAEYWKYRDKFLHHDLFGGYRSLASDMTHSGALERAIFSLQYEIDQIESPFLYPGRAASEYAAADRPVIRDRKELAAFLKQGLSYLKTLDPKSSKGIPKPRKPTIRGGGNIYTVAVKLPAEATIQYDKPFGQQPERVQQAFREAAEAGTLGEAADLIAKYGAATRMGPLVAALKKSDTPAMGIMRRNGVRGVRYLDGMSRGKRNPANQTFNYVVFNDGDVKVLDRKGLLFQELDQQRRGQFSPSRNIITMFEAADVTTLMHEGAHWYLAEIERMAMAENAHPFVTEQWEAVKKWGKVGPDFRMYDDMGRVTPEGRELQEAFAETFEVYLQTGKAPTDSLREAFRAFKAWITALWRDIRTGKISLPERANLSPEIAQVMDRMLAVDEEINAQAAGTITRAEQQAKELLDRGIITQKQYDKALNDLDAAREAAKEDLMARIMDAEMRVRQAQLGVEQRRIKGDVVREFDRSPVGRALSWLGYGQWKGDVPTAETREDAADFEMYQSVRTATTMPMQEVTSWVLEHTEANIQQINDDEVVVLNFTVDDTPNGAPVRMSIRLQPTGRADVNLFLNGQLADSLSGVTDRMERARVGRELFSRAIMALRQYAAETPDLKAIHFVAAESKAKGTKEKSRERLYRSMLSTLQMEGYTAYEIEQQMGLVREEDGVKSSEPRIGFTGFVLIRDGVDPNEFARNEILRGTQTGGDVGEIVTAFRATQLGGAARRAADGEGPGTRGPVGGGAVDDTLGQEARKVDTSVAGGLTEKSFIGTRELEGVTIFPMFADLTDAGSTFAALDGLPIAPTPYLGGPNFPWLSAYRDAGIVWAFNAPGVITKVRNKVKALQKQARAEGRSDRVIITMLAMKDDAHTSNEMVISALLRTLDAVVEAGRFPQEQLAEAKKLIVSKAGKKDEGYSELATFPGFDNAEALHDWSRGATFAGRKALAKEMRSAKFQQLPGMFPVERIVREAIDPD